MSAWTMSLLRADMPALAYAVKLIGLIRSKEQVTMSYATRIVTGMADLHSSRNWSVE